MTEHPNLPAPIELQSAALARPMSPSMQFPDDGETKSGGPGLKRYLLAVYRYKWLVLLLVITGTAGGAFASKYVRLNYVAQATLWLERNDLMGAGPIQSSQLLKSDAWIDLMRSFMVIDYVVKEQRLYLSYAPRDTAVMASFEADSTYTLGEFRLEVDAAGQRVELRTRNGLLVETARAGEPIGKKLGFSWQPPVSELTPKRRVDFTLVTPRDGSLLVLNKLDTRITKTANHLRVQYSGDNPTLVANVVNAVVERYVNVAADLKRNKLAELTNILEGQLAYAQKNLNDAESALQNFQVATVTLPSEPDTPVPGSDATRASVVAGYFQTRIQQDGLRRDRDAIERALATGQGDSISLDALSIVATAQQSPELGAALTDLATKRAALRALQQTYTNEHRQVKQAVAEVQTLERQVIPELAKRLMTELQERERALEDMAEAATAELRAIPPRSIEEGRLQRAVSTADRLYGDLLQRVENARLAAATTLPDVSILDAAVAPRRAALDQRMKLVMMGFMMTLGLGVGLALLLDRMDPRLRYAEQVTDDLGLMIIGAVPSIGRPKRKLLGGPTDGPQVLEALRSIRLGLMNAYGTAGPLMVTVSSPGTGDGKTFITSNLGLAFADLGVKTLVIDGDTRRGGIHRLFDVQRKPGLTDYLKGTVAMDEVVYTTKFPLVDFIPCGTRCSNAPELLSSPRMGDLLARIRSEYQVILIDSPPLGAGVDPLLLGTLAGNMLLVMRTGTTDRSMAEAKLKMLDKLPIRILGTVLNGFDSGDAFRYYSYMPGYETGHEEAERDAMLQPA